MVRESPFESCHAQLRPNGACGTGVHSCDQAAFGPEKEGQMYRQHHRFPLWGVEVEVCQLPYASWDTQMLAALLSTEQDGALIATTCDLLRFALEQMLVT